MKPNQPHVLVVALAVAMGLAAPPATAVIVPSQSDTFVSNGNGDRDVLKVGDGATALLRFDLSTLPRVTQVQPVPRAPSA